MVDLALFLKKINSSMQPLRLLDANRNIQNLKILLRVDFNVPLQNQQVSDATKIIKVKPIIHSLLQREQKLFYALI